MASLDAQTGSEHDQPMSGDLAWALCVATFNRIDALKVCVARAVEQSRPPKEIVIVDASPNWGENREVIEAVLSGHPIPMIYQKAKKKSLCVQRNQGISETSADILFLIDDDSFLYPDCAAKIMRIYEKDLGEKIACVAAISAPSPPSETDASEISNRVASQRGLKGLLRKALPPGVKRFVSRELLLRDLEKRFIPYDRLGYEPHAALPASLDQSDALPLRLVSGFRITVRRRIAVIERFDEGLLAYCPAEDLDCTYRFLRHGRNVAAQGAYLYHHKATSGLLKSWQIAELSTLNIAYFLRAKSVSPALHFVMFYVWGLRRLLAASIDDLLASRWSLPTAMGTAAAIRKSFAVFRRPRDQLLPWYETVQSGILSNFRN